jgi:hypothetical protein
MSDIYFEKFKKTKKIDHSISMVPKTVAAQSTSTVSETNEVIARLTATEIEIAHTKDNLRKDIETMCKLA